MLFWSSVALCDCWCSCVFLVYSASDRHGGCWHGTKHLPSRQHWTARLSLQHDGCVSHITHHRAFHLLVLLPQEKGGSPRHPQNAISVSNKSQAAWGECGFPSCLWWVLGGCVGSSAGFWEVPRWGDLVPNHISLPSRFFWAVHLAMEKSLWKSQAAALPYPTVWPTSVICLAQASQEKARQKSPWLYFKTRIALAILCFFW